MDLAQRLQECEAADTTKVFLVVTEDQRRMVQRLLSQEPVLDDTKVFLTVTETERAVLHCLLSQEPALLGVLERWAFRSQPMSGWRPCCWRE